MATTRSLFTHVLTLVVICVCLTAEQKQHGYSKPNGSVNYPVTAHTSSINGHLFQFNVSTNSSSTSINKAADAETDFSTGSSETPVLHAPTSNLFSQPESSRESHEIVVKGGETETEVSTTLSPPTLKNVYERARPDVPDYMALENDGTTPDSPVFLPTVKSNLTQSASEESPGITLEATDVMKSALPIVPSLKDELLKLVSAVNGVARSGLSSSTIGNVDTGNVDRNIPRSNLLDQGSPIPSSSSTHDQSMSTKDSFTKPDPTRTEETMVHSSTANDIDPEVTSVQLHGAFVRQDLIKSDLTVVPRSIPHDWKRLLGTENAIEETNLMGLSLPMIHPAEPGNQDRALAEADLMNSDSSAVFTQISNELKGPVSHENAIKESHLMSLSTFMAPAVALSDFDRPMWTWNPDRTIAGPDFADLGLAPIGPFPTDSLDLSIIFNATDLQHADINETVDLNDELVPSTDHSAELLTAANGIHSKLNTSIVMYSDITRVADLLFYIENPSFSPSAYIEHASPCKHTCDKDSSNLSSAKPYCIPCDCSDDCYASGMCCLQKEGDPDYLIDGLAATKNKEVCTLPVAAFDPMSWTTLLLKEGRMSYLMVTSCDERYSGEAEMKCLHQKATSMLEMTPVHSTQTNLSYASIYCAECNFIDVDQVIPWAPNIVCTYLDNDLRFLFDTSMSMDDLLLNINTMQDCALWWAPKEWGHKTCIQSGESIRLCKESLTTNRQILNNLCEQVMSPIKLGENIHKNVFCYLCQKDDGSLTAIDVPTFVDSIPETFNALLNTYTPENEQGITDLKKELIENGNCDEGFIYIIAMHTCLRTSCPPSMFYSAGKCIPYITNLVGAYLEIQLTISIHRTFYPFFLPDEDVLLLSRQLLSYFITACSHVIDSVKSQEWAHYTVKLTILKKDSISIKDTFILINQYLQSNAQSPERQFDAKFSGTYYDQGGISGFAYYLSFKDSGDPCPPGIAMTEEQICKTVVLKDYQVQISSNGSLIVQNYTFQEHEYYLSFGMFGDASVHICEDKFLKRLGQSDLKLDTQNQSITLPKIAMISNGTLSIVCSSISMLGVLFLCIVQIYQECRSPNTPYFLNTVTVHFNVILAQLFLQLSQYAEASAAFETVTFFFWLAHCSDSLIASAVEFRRFQVNVNTPRSRLYKWILARFAVVYVISASFTVVGQVCVSDNNQLINHLIHCSEVLKYALSLLSFHIPIFAITMANLFLFILLRKQTKTKSATSSEPANRKSVTNESPGDPREDTVQFTRETHANRKELDNDIANDTITTKAVFSVSSFGKSSKHNISDSSNGTSKKKAALNPSSCESSGIQKNIGIETAKGINRKQLVHSLSSLETSCAILRDLSVVNSLTCLMWLSFILEKWLKVTDMTYIFWVLNAMHGTFMFVSQAMTFLGKLCHNKPQSSLQPRSRGRMMELESNHGQPDQNEAHDIEINVP